MATLNGGRGELNDAAAASIHRVDRQIGRLLQITEARRPLWLQEQYWDEYQEYLNGGPWAPIAAYPSPDAPHIRNGGEALDTDDRITRVLNENGWFHTVYDGDGNLVEPWHYEYFIDRDQHRFDPAPSAIDLSQEDEMKLIRWNGRHVFGIAKEAVYHVPDPGQLEKLTAVYGDYEDVDDAGLTAVLLYNGVHWDAVDTVLKGRGPAPAGGRYWSRLMAEGIAIRGAQEQTRKTLADVLVTADKIAARA